jgi:protein-tyrosine-phosphatase
MRVRTQGMKAVAKARRVARLLLHGRDRIAHPLRRRQAQRTLTQMGWPRSVLLVCHGNICRSPYAAAALARRLPVEVREWVDVRSAGFIGPHRQPPTEALRVAAQRGLDLSKHFSSLLSSENTREAELVIVMNAAQRRAVIDLFGVEAKRVIVLGDLDPEAIETRTIRDPIGQSEAVFAASYSRIERCLDGLVSALSEAEVERDRLISQT